MVLIFRGREGANLSDVSTTTMMTATTKKRRSRAKAMQPSPHRRPPRPAFRPASKARKLTRNELNQMLADVVRRTAAMGRRAS
jgi:hypothetical protein